MKNHIYSKTIINRKYYRRTLTPRPILPTPLSKIPNLLSHETQHHLTYKTTLLEISLSVRKKEGRKNNKNRPLFRSRNHSTSLERDEETKRRRGRGKDGGNIRDEKNLMSVNSPFRGGRTCKRRKEFFLTPVIPFIARGTARHSAPACNGPGYWRVAVLMNFGVHVLRETRGTSRMPPDASATLARYWRGNSRNPLRNAKGWTKTFVVNLFLLGTSSRANFKFHTRIFYFIYRIHRIVDYRSSKRIGIERRRRKFGQVCRCDLKIEDITGKIKCGEEEFEGASFQLSSSIAMYYELKNVLGLVDNSRRDLK